MMSREKIIAEIQRLAAISGGRLSKRAFCEQSGIREKQFLGVYWAKWNDALSEAGVKDTNSFFQEKTEDSVVVEALAEFTNRLGKWPTENELLIEKRNNPSFPYIKVIRRVPQLASRIAAYCADKPGLSIAREIALQVAKSEKTDSPSAAATSGYVYMMQTGRRYKIGHTNSPSRRHREVRLELPDPTTVIHTIATDDPVGVESYWHNRFKQKRIRDTEFFELDASEVAAFKRWKRII